MCAMLIGTSVLNASHMTLYFLLLVEVVVNHVKMKHGVVKMVLI
jgi:hypothetical protein